MNYKVIARQHGNTVEFEVEGGTLKEAFRNAKTEACGVFEYSGFGAAPTVNLRPLKNSADPEDIENTGLEPEEIEEEA